MKAIVVLVILLAVGSAAWWVTLGLTPAEQLEYLKVTLQSESASNTVDSASKLGKVLKSNFNEAQDVYEHGAEAKYE